jgi:hypothetical protein
LCPALFWSLSNHWQLRNMWLSRCNYGNNHYNMDIYRSHITRPNGMIDTNQHLRLRWPLCIKLGAISSTWKLSKITPHSHNLMCHNHSAKIASILYISYSDPRRQALYWRRQQKPQRNQLKNTSYIPPDPITYILIF